MAGGGAMKPNPNPGRDGPLKSTGSACGDLGTGDPEEARWLLCGLAVLEEYLYKVF